MWCNNFAWNSNSLLAFMKWVGVHYARLWDDYLNTDSLDSWTSDHRWRQKNSHNFESFNSLLSKLTLRCFVLRPHMHCAHITYAFWPPYIKPENQLCFAVLRFFPPQKKNASHIETKVKVFFSSHVCFLTLFHIFFISHIEPPRRINSLAERATHV